MADKEVDIMSSVGIHLRLEARNGFPAKEYRIQRGSVEVRTFDCESDHMHTWSRLTPEQLSTHVKHHTVVARWLEHRLGWRRLLRACVGMEPRIPSGSRVEVAEIVQQHEAWV